MNVMALGAHPDDIEIFMFGTLAAFTARGDALSLVVATDGAKGGTGDPAALARQRRAEAITGAAALGVEPAFLDFPDGGLVADAALVGAIKSQIGAHQPHLIVTHAPNDYHGDHRALSDAVRIAASFSAPVLWADTLHGVGFAPTHYIDITSHWAAKVAAIRAHASQDPERFVAQATMQNAFRSWQANVRDGYAEAFRFDPVYPFVDIRDLLPPAPPLAAVRDRAKA